MSPSGDCGNSSKLLFLALLIGVQSLYQHWLVFFFILNQKFRFSTILPFSYSVICQNFYFYLFQLDIMSILACLYTCKHNQVEDFCFEYQNPMDVRINIKTQNKVLAHPFLQLTLSLTFGGIIPEKIIVSFRMTTTLPMLHIFEQHSL